MGSIEEVVRYNPRAEGTKVYVPLCDFQDQMELFLEQLRKEYHEAEYVLHSAFMYPMSHTRSYFIMFDKDNKPIDAGHELVRRNIPVRE